MNTTLTRRRLLPALLGGFGAIAAGFALPDRTSAAAAEPHWRGAGQFEILDPSVRLLDTRTGGRPKPGTGTVLSVTTGFLNIVAAYVNLTVTEPEAGGYLTAWSGVALPPKTSSLNWGNVHDPADINLSNGTVVPVDNQGRFAIVVFANGQHAHVVVDLIAVYNDPASIP